MNKINNLMQYIPLNKCWYDKIFIAGGYAFSSLFGTKTNDIDIFIHSCNIQRAIHISKRLLFDIIRKYDKKRINNKKIYDFSYIYYNIYRTKNSIILKINEKYEGTSNEVYNLM